MSAPVFLAPVAALAAATAGGCVEVTGAEGRHAVTVRRLRAGEPVEVVDGAGRRVRGRVDAVQPPDRLRVRVSQVHDELLGQPRIVVVQALPKGDRAEQAVQLLTEVGVDVVVPWSAARSVPVWRAERAGRALDRWRATAREAAKQCRRSRVPEVLDLATTADVADLVVGSDRAYLLDQAADRALAAERPGPAGSVLVVVGPEGGLTPQELDQLGAAGGIPVRLGPTVLRTSTAGAVAAVLVAASGGRWN